MGVMADIRAAWSAPSVSDDGHWTSRGGGDAHPSQSGVTITRDIARSNPVVFDCDMILQDAVGQLPVILYDRAGTDGSERQKARTALAYRLAEQPNRDLSAIEFKREMQGAADFYPWAYAEIEWRGAEPIDITPRDPARIRVAKVTGGRRRYEFLEDDDRTWRPILVEDILRVPGRPVLKYASETLGHAIALERYSARLFGKSPRPAAVLTAEKGVRYDDKQRKDIRETLLKNTSGANAGGLAWVPEGLQFNPWGMTNEQAQFTELRNSIVGDITRYWRIPPYMVGLLQSGTVSYASVSTQSVDFVVYCLMPWLVGWEQAIQRDLIVDKRGQFVEFLAAQMLRGTTAERYAVYQIAINAGIMSVNDVRRLENMNPIPGGDQYLRPLNMTTSAMARHVETGSQAERLLLSFAQDAAGRVIRREQGALAKVAERAGPDAKAWESGVKEFYAGHGTFVAEALKLPATAATSWADTQMWAVLAEGPEAVATWGRTQSEQLAAMALERSIPDLGASAVADLRSEVIALRSGRPAAVAATAPAVTIDQSAIARTVTDAVLPALDERVAPLEASVADAVTAAQRATSAASRVEDLLASVADSMAATVRSETDRAIERLGAVASTVDQRVSAAVETLARPAARTLERDPAGRIAGWVTDTGGRRIRTTVEHDASGRVTGTRDSIEES